MSIASSSALRAQTRRSFYLCSIDGLFAVPLVFLNQPGNYLCAALLTNVFHISERYYGWVASLPSWCNFAQIFVLPFVARKLVAKRVTILSGWLHFTAWLVLTLTLPYLPISQPETTGRFFVLFFFIFSLLLAFNSVSWNSWVHEWAAESLRGRYFGFRNGLIQVATIAFLALVGTAFSFMPMRVLTFQIVFFFALALRAVSLLAQNAMKVGRSHKDPEKELPHLSQLGIIFRAPSLLLFIFFGVVWGVGSNCFGPFYSVFMLNELHLSPTTITVLVILGSLALALSFPGWGLLIDRFGNKAVMLTSILLLQGANYIWCLVTPGSTWLLYFLFIWCGYTNAGFLLGSFNLLLKVAPPEAKTLAMGLNLSATSLAMAFAAVAGGNLLAWGRNLGFSGLTLYHVAFLFQPTSALVACLVLFKIKERRDRGVIALMQALLSREILASLLGATAIKKWRAESSS